MRLDMTISIGDVLAVLSICATLGGAAWALIRKLDEVLIFFREFPPHRHVQGKILYPKGYAPEEPEDLQQISSTRGAHV